MNNYVTLVVVVAGIISGAAFAADKKAEPKKETKVEKKADAKKDAKADAQKLAKYKIDVAHSTVGFEVSHLVISTVTGKFTKVDGQFEFDPTDFSKTKLESNAEASSVDTGNEKRDKHLKSDDFFDAAKHPKITFKSTSAKSTGKDTFDLTGDFSMHGVTKPVTFKVRYLGQVTAFEKVKTAFKGEAEINRKDFKMSFNKVAEAGPLVGDQVKIVIHAEGDKE